MAETHLNYHHLRYFWAVANDGNLSRTAARLRIAPSALSAQIRQLEAQLGEPLFAREQRRLKLTEAGLVALEYANDIFTTGKELVATFEHGRKREHLLRIGAVSTLSRNFQESFVRPLLDEDGVKLRFSSGNLDDLCDQLAKHSLDVVLANRPVERKARQTFRCRHVARQKVSLVSRKRRRNFQFPDDIVDVPLVLPAPDTALRVAFDALCERLNLTVRVFAEVDDMAMMRLIARDTDAVALLPPVVVRDELRSRVLRECCVVPDLYEDFYAITVERRYPHPLVSTLLARKVEELLRAP